MSATTTTQQNMKTDVKIEEVEEEENRGKREKGEIITVIMRSSIHLVTEVKQRRGPG
jgi:hypothetical protein